MQDTQSIMTVQDVAALPGLHLRVETGTLGLARHVEVPLAVDVAPADRRLQGGELILTSGSLLGPDAAAWEDLFGRLKVGGASGLILSLGPDAAFDRTPEMLVQLGRRYGLPVLTAPASTSFSAITQAIMEARTRSDRAVLEAASALQVRLLGIVTRGGNIDRLLAEWSRSTGEETGVFDRVGRIVGRSQGLAAADIETARTLLRQSPPRLGDNARINGQDGELTVAPFAGETTVRGYLVGSRSETAAAGLALRTLLSLLALEFERRWFLDEPARRRRSAHFARLIDNDDAGRARALLRSVDLDATELRGVVVEAESETRAEVLLDDLAVVLGTPLLRLRDRRVEALTPHDPKRALLEFGVDSAVGVGTPVAPSRAGKSIRQAASALETSRRLGRLVEFADGAAHDFLLRIADADYLTAFADAVLEPIDVADNGQVLLATLHTWLAEGRSIDACARHLDVHRHTVRNRMQRITQLTGRDLESVDTQTEVWLALKARGYRDGDPPGTVLG